MTAINNKILFILQLYITDILNRLYTGGTVNCFLNKSMEKYKDTSITLSFGNVDWELYRGRILIRTRRDGLDDSCID